MKKHLSRQQLIHYLEGTLTPAERQAVWAHLQKCSKCYARVRQEQHFSTDIQRDFAGFGKREDFSAMLPGILAETRRTPVMQRPLTIMVTVFMAVIAFFPLVPHLTHTTYARDTELLNIPVSTRVVPLDKTTLEAKEADSVSEIQETAFNIKYASPAPYPQATADGSPVPDNPSE